MPILFLVKGKRFYYQKSNEAPTQTYRHNPYHTTHPKQPTQKSPTLISSSTATATTTTKKQNQQLTKTSASYS